MRTTFSLAPTLFVACVAAIAGAHAAVTVSSENFAFTANWPAGQPVAAGSTVPATPPNIAAATNGAVPFAIGEYGGPHRIAYLNDGRYGNAYSWITASLTLSRNVALGGAYGTVNMSFAGVALSNAAPFTVTDIVFGRTAVGEYSDRIDGTMYLQVTTTNSVAEITRTDAAADAQWTTLGSFTTTDVYEHQFHLTPPLNITGVRIVTKAGNCIDEIVVHGEPVAPPTWGAADFVWTNETGGAWTTGVNWANSAAPSTGNNKVFFMVAPLSGKTVTVPSSGSDLASLAVDASPGTAEAVTFTGGPLNFWDPRTLYAKGSTVCSNSVRSWAEIRLNGPGSVAFTAWGGLALSHPRLHASGTRLAVSGAESDQTFPAQLPANPWMHLDASDASSFAIEEAGGVKYVQTWSDVRANGVYASAPFAKNRPVLNTGNGLPHVDFGLLNRTQTDGTLDGQHLWWSATNTHLRAVFLVYSDAASGDKQNFIGSLADGLPFHRGPGGRFFDPAASVYLRNGTQTLDGTSVNGVETILPTGFHVVGLTTLGGGVKGDVFARDNLGHAGGQKLSEVVLYDRELTPAECQAAEAYLLYKWLGSARSGYADGAGQAALLTLANSATLEAQTDFRALELRLDGYASKEGNGQLTAARITQPYGTFTMNGGTLAVAGDLLSEDADLLLPDPWMHLDASDYTNSMTVTEADGTLYVEGWSDVRANGIAAFPPWASSRPLLITNGLNRLPYVDFGPLMIGTINGPHLLWNQTNAAMRTVVLVYSDSEPDPRSCFLGNLEGTIRYYRGANRTLLHANAPGDIRNGRLTLDGKAAEPATYMTPGFHVFSSVTATGVRSDVFARDKVSWTGGQKLAEVLIYNVPLTDAQLRLVEQRLMRKWLASDRLGYAGALQAPAPAPAPDAWLHLDASDTNTLTLVESGGVRYVQAWADVRANGVYTYAPFAKNRPVLRTGSSFPHVDFGLLNTAKTGGTLDGQHLWWSQTNTNLRTVFLVTSDAVSGVKQNFIGSLADGLPFARGASGLFLGSAASAYLKDGTHSLDFTRVVGLSTLLPEGFHVVGLRTQGGGVKGDVFARDRDAHAGGQKLAEVLVYDRPLDDMEFAATGSYLMRKWLGAATEQDSALNRLKGLADTTLDVGEGRTLTCKTTEIAGALEKRGAGRLMITTGSASRLSVLGGELWIEQPFTTGGGTLSSLTLSNNATLNLRQNALSVQTLTGAGTVSNGTVTAAAVAPGTLGGAPQTLTIAGDLVLSAGCEIAADASGAGCDGVVVSGRLTLPANGRVTVSFPPGARLPASQRLCTFDTLSGAPNLAGWSLELTPGGIYTASLVLSDRAIDIVYHPRGTVILVH
jgi:hypothetical protein